MAALPPSQSFMRSLDGDADAYDYSTFGVSPTVPSEPAPTYSFDADGASTFSAEREPPGGLAGVGARGIEYAHPQRRSAQIGGFTWSAAGEGDEDSDEGDDSYLREDSFQRAGDDMSEKLDDGDSFAEKGSRSFLTPSASSDSVSVRRLHFGAPPEDRQPRRRANMVARRVNLTNGNLVLNPSVPTKLYDCLPRKQGEEFETMRYTAVTCRPEDYAASGEWTLRSLDYGRTTELLIVITLFSEDETLLMRTLHGVMKNIAQLCARKKSAKWGKESWKNIVVCLVADGRAFVNPRVLNCLSVLGLYQEGLAKNIVDDKPVTAHVFEYTSQHSVTPDLQLRGLEKGITPVQLMFVLKENNAKKLNSHRWAMEGVAAMLDPNVIVLLDAGTKPANHSIYHLWKAFDRHGNTGGACGEIVAMKGKAWLGLLNPVVAAQDFEYKMSNILDKPTESVFGYISVLPGAFSAYRWRALRNDQYGHGPLASYFKGEELAGKDADVFTANMYLAEDRILCWELVAKKSHNWVLRYVKAAKGETDVPKGIVEFINQRRRWLNGSFFAGVYALTHTGALLRTNHTVWKKTALLLEAVYNAVNLVFAWFGVANYYIFFMVLTTSLEAESLGLKGIKYANMLMQYAYMGTIVACFLFAMGNRPKGSPWKYMIAMIIFSLTTTYMIAGAAYCLYKAITGFAESIILAQIVISLLSTYGCYILASLIALDPWHLITSMPQYILLSPVYINLLNIFAFCNLHDFTWGTKVETKQQTDLGTASKKADGVVEIELPSLQADIDEAFNEAASLLKSKTQVPPKPMTADDRKMEQRDYYANVRTNVLLVWALTNALLASVILQGDYSSTFTSKDTDNTNRVVQVYMVVILVFVALMSVIRLIGSTAYNVMRLCDRLSA